ncbi:phosphopantetheine-binding protein [Paenibacillus tarimensis]|uniref:phosphopantetheine-binding protein n=1 Tax=Paenibacillus tarimensis TaxID=416012 RepID=UPI001F1F8583|nr:phosphopantetheine-binding protein [Paenibacillus tarimensis]MCF2945160.1 phosphopantetheine-binding protein [Paenibacillus tarimensis]
MDKEMEIQVSIQEAIINLIGKSVNEQVDWNDPELFAKLDIDSATMIEFLLYLEEKLDISIRVEDMAPEDFINMRTLTECLLRLES